MSFVIPVLLGRQREAREGYLEKFCLISLYALSAERIVKMSSYTRELPSLSAPVILFVSKSLHFGRHGDFSILFLDSEDEVPERGYERRPFKVVLASEQDAKEWMNLYQSSETLDARPNRSAEEYDEDHKVSEEERARMSQLEQAGQMAEARWTLLVAAPQFIGQLGEMLERAPGVFRNALDSAEKLGFPISEEEREDESCKQVSEWAFDLPGLYRLARRLELLEERLCPREPEPKVVAQPRVEKRHSRTPRPQGERPQRIATEKRSEVVNS